MTGLTNVRLGKRLKKCATAIYEWSKENETRDEEDEKIVPQMFDIGDDEEDEDEDESEDSTMTLVKSDEDSRRRSDLLMN